ncbi:hypothetical protein BH10BAC6_BH10BAC6_08480 [soil metagenome]
MNTPTYDGASFLREHLSQARATDDFEQSVLALTALNRLSAVVIPESFEQVILRHAGQMRLVRTLFYTTMSVGILASIAYFIYFQNQRVHIAANYEVPAIPSLLIPSKVTPPAVPTHVDPPTMHRLEIDVKSKKVAAPLPNGVTGY